MFYVLDFFQSCPVSYTKTTHILNGNLNLALLSPKLQLFPKNRNQNIATEEIKNEVCWLFGCLLMSSLL